MIETTWASGILMRVISFQAGQSTVGLLNSGEDLEVLGGDNGGQVSDMYFLSWLFMNGQG